MIYYVCPQDEGGTLTPLIERSNNMDYNHDFKELAQMKALKAEAEAEIAKIEERIKNKMLEEGKDTVIGDEHKATYKEVVSNRFDSTSFKKDHADMYESYKKPSTSMRFTFA